MLRVLMVFMEHPAGGRLCVGLSDPVGRGVSIRRIMVSLDPSGPQWNAMDPFLAEQAFAASSREGDGYRMVREKLLVVSLPDLGNGDPQWQGFNGFHAWKTAVLDAARPAPETSTVDWVQGQPVIGDTRPHPDGVQVWNGFGWFVWNGFGWVAVPRGSRRTI